MSHFQLLKKRIPLRFTQNFLISLFAVIFLRALSLISLPVFTNLLTLEEFGVWRIFFNTFNMVCCLMMLGMNAPILRYFPRYIGKENEHRFRDTIFTSLAISGFLVLFLLWIGRWALCNFLNIEMKFSRYFVWVGIAAFFFVFFNGGLYFFRVRKAFWHNAGYMIVQGLFFVLLAIWALGRGWGVAGILGALIFSYVAVGLYLPFRNRLWGAVKLDRAVLISSMALGLPAAAHALIQWGNTFSDRYLIQKFIGSEQVALYGLPCNLMITLVSLLMMSLNIVLAPHIVKVWENDRTEAERKLRLVMRIYALLLAAGVIGLNLVIRPVVVFLSNPNYLRDLNVLPTFTIGVFCLGLYNVMAIYYLLHERLGLYVILNCIGWCVNISINVLFLPRIGIFASAIAAAVSHLLIFVLCLAGVIFLSRSSRRGEIKITEAKA